MYKFLSKYGQTISFILSALILFGFGISASFGNLPTTELNGTYWDTKSLDFGFYWVMILMAICLVAILGFSIFQIAGNFKDSWKGLAGFGVLLLMFIVTYNLSSGEATGPIGAAVASFEESNNMKISSGNLKFIGGGIITSILLIVIALAAFVLAEIRNFFK